MAGKARTGNLEPSVWSKEQNDSFHFACGWNEGSCRAAGLACVDVGLCIFAARLGFSAGPDSDQVLANSAVTASFILLTPPSEGSRCPVFLRMPWSGWAKAAK